MNFASRDRYRHAVEELAENTGEAQLRVALRSVESARQAFEKDPDDERTGHVGYHLIGRGRRDLEIDVAWYPDPGQRARRFIFAHATAAYLGTTGLVTVAGLGLAAWYAMTRGGSGGMLLAVLLL